MRRVVVAVGVLLLTSVAGLAAGSGSMEAFLAGKVAPFTRQVKDLDGSYLRFALPYMSGSGWLGSMSRYGGEAPPAYTQGQTVTIGGEVYLIAYAVESKGGDASGLMYGRPNPNAPDPEPVTANSTLSLVLLGQRSFAALGKVRPFDLTTELADYQRYLTSYQEMMATRSAMNSPTMVSAAPPPDDPKGASGTLKNVAMALDMFTGDHDGVLPPMDKAESFREALDDYIESADMFRDPETGEAYGLNASLSGKKLTEIQDPAKTIAVYQVNHGRDGKRGVVFLDFSVTRVTEAEWTDLKAKSNIP